MSDGIGDEYEEVVYYWDEETELYYYWDETYQAYVAWVEEGIDPDNSTATEVDVAPATEDLGGTYDLGVSTGFTVQSMTPDGNNSAKGPAIGTSTAQPASTLSPAALMSEEMVAEEVVVSDDSDLEALRDLEKEARRGSTRQNTVRRLTRKLTVTAKGQKSLAEQLALVAKARKNAGQLLTDEEMIRQQKERVLRRMAREQAGLPPEENEEDDDDDNENDITGVSSPNPSSPNASSPSSSPSSSSTSPLAPPKRSTTYQRSQLGGRRETARFGTAHFKDSKIGNRLEALLARKLK